MSPKIVYTSFASLFEQLRLYLVSSSTVCNDEGLETDLHPLTLASVNLEEEEVKNYICVVIKITGSEEWGILVEEVL